MISRPYSSKERLLRLVVFLIVLLVLTSCAGMIMSRAHMTRRNARLPMACIAAAGAIASYVLAYRPGIAYDWLIGREEQRDEHD